MGLSSDEWVRIGVIIGLSAMCVGGGWFLIREFLRSRRERLRQTPVRPQVMVRPEAVMRSETMVRPEVMARPEAIVRPEAGRPEQAREPEGEELPRGAEVLPPLEQFVKFMARVEDRLGKIDYKLTAIQTSGNENEELRQDGERLQLKKRKLLDTSRHLQQDYDRLQQEKQKLQEAGRQLQQENERLEHEKRKLQGTGQQLQEDNKRLLQERRRLEETGRQLQQDNERLREELDRATRKLETEKERITESLRWYLHSRLLVGTIADNGKVAELVDQAIQAIMPSTADSTPAAPAEESWMSRQEGRADPAGKRMLCWDLIAALLEFRRAVAGMSTAETVKYAHNLSEPIVEYVGGGGFDKLPDLQQWASAIQAFLGRCRPEGAEWAELSIYVPPLGPNSELTPRHARWKETTMKGFMREMLRWKATAYDGGKGELSNELAVVMP